ncbi:hypothetical protein SDC9_136236 [bioreactor metagenome]|uniref:Uncharacterized protein n=1 Tax=bioreactor metagenome TaxID=1076179 RepID=A0A645DJB2_9ZZZZ
MLIRAVVAALGVCFMNQPVFHIPHMIGQLPDFIADDFLCQKNIEKSHKEAGHDAQDEKNRRKNQIGRHFSGKDHKKGENDPHHDSEADHIDRQVFKYSFR